MFKFVDIKGNGSSVVSLKVNLIFNLKMRVTLLAKEYAIN